MLKRCVRLHFTDTCFLTNTKGISHLKAYVLVYSWHSGPFAWPLFPLKISMDYIFWVCVSLRYPACKAHALLWQSVACSALLHFPTLRVSQTARLSGKKKSLNIICVFWSYLQLLCETFLILRIIQRDITVNVQYIGLHVRYRYLWSGRENQQHATVRCLLSILSQHVSGIIMPIFRRTRRVLLHVVCCAGSAGCGW